MIAFIFPGQGSQAVGMGKGIYENYPATKEVFDKANELLGWSLTDLCFNGPDETLKQTQNAQPALYTVGFATYQILKNKGISPSFTAGHSLGEYSALAAAGVFDFDSGLKLVKERGRLMGEAGKIAPGAMAAVLGLSEEEIKPICEEISVTVAPVVVANYNCPGQIVISGDSSGVSAVVSKLKEMKKKAIPLPVSGAFHSPLMQIPSDQYSNILNSVTFKDAAFPVISNVTGLESCDADELKSALSSQMTSAVRWEASIKRMLSLGVKHFVEVGSGTVLSGLVKKISKEVTTYQTGDMETLEATMNTLKNF